MREPAQPRTSEPGLFDEAFLAEPVRQQHDAGAAQEASTQLVIEPSAAEPVVTQVADLGRDSGTSPRTAVAQVLVATDGSCLRNPGGPTGWAYVRSDGHWAYGGDPVGTNQIGAAGGRVGACRPSQ